MCFCPLITSDIVFCMSSFMNNGACGAFYALGIDSKYNNLITCCITSNTFRCIFRIVYFNCNIIIYNILQCLFSDIVFVQSIV